MRRLAGIAALVTLTPLARSHAQAANVEQFSPAVAAGDTTAACEVMPPAVLGEGEHGWLLRYGSKENTVRAVSAVWDSAGRLTKYSDVRGDLRGGVAPPERNERTSILINLSQGTALLLNEAHGKAHGSMMSTSDAAMKSVHLGPPRAMVARLHDQCGAPTS